MTALTENEVEITIEHDNEEGQVEFCAYVNSQRVGWLILAGNGVVMDLMVRAKFRRQGIATKMWRAAQDTFPGARHSVVISAEGLEWADSLGEPLVQAMPAVAGLSI